MALAGPAGSPRRYLLHSDIQPDDIIRPGALLHYHRPNGWQSHLLLTYQSASRMWQWRDLTGKPPWHSAVKITPAHALAWWVAEHGLDLSPEDRMRLDASSATMVHCSTGDPLPPRLETPGPGSRAGPAQPVDTTADPLQPPSKR
eukprot:1650657-Amphidinium_carterae.1